MTRFVSPDLVALGDLPLPPASFEATEGERLELLAAAMEAHGLPFDRLGSTADPLRIAFTRGGGHVETLIDQRIREAMRDVSLATARREALDHIAATFYGISRSVNEPLDDAGDERFRDRIALAPEAFSTAGPEGAYVFHALELDGVADVADVAVYAEEDGATYSPTLHADAFSTGRRPTPFAGRDEGDPVLAPEILVVIVPTVAHGACDQALVDRVWHAVTAKDVRPLGDNVRVEAASVVDYQVDLTIGYRDGADPDLMASQAREHVERYTAERRRVGLVAERLGLGGGAYVAGTETLDLASPAADVGGGRKVVPNCTEIEISTVREAGSWRT